MLCPSICEVCGETDESTLHKHHIVPRSELGSDNSDYNLAVLCSNCHSKVHRGNLKIIGLYPSTKLPYKRILVYEVDGYKNVDLELPYCTPKQISMKIPGKV